MNPWFHKTNRPFGTSFGGHFGFPLPSLFAIDLSSEKPFLRNRLGTRDASAIPYDLVETAESYRLSLEVPGFRPEEIDISLDGDVLRVVADSKVQARDEATREVSTLSEEQSSDHSQEKETVRVDARRGRARREFEIELGGLINTEQIESRLDLGVLEIHLPKLKAAAKRSIPIHVVS